MTVQMPDIYAQLRLPGTELAVRAYRLSHQSTPEFVFNHSVRSYLFAEALAGTRNLRPSTDYDQELLFLECVLHDIGLSDRADDNQRFEVGGADLAAEFLREQHVPPQRIAVVWDAIARHTSDGIAGRKHPRSRSPSSASPRTSSAEDATSFPPTSSKASTAHCRATT